MSFLFGPKDKRTPYEKARDQTREISATVRQEKRQLDRQIDRSDREIQRLSNDIRKHALANNKDALKTLAKAIVKVKHDKSHLYAAKANLDSIENAVKSQLTNVRLTGVMQKSSDIAQSLADLMKVEQLQGVSRQFNEEMIKMGIMNEMIDEAVSGALDNPDLEDEADEEVAKVLDEVLAKGVRQLPTIVPDQRVETGVAAADSEDEEMKARLQALKA